VDSRERYIYLHGTNHEAELGRPASHGCIRLANAAILELFERVARATGGGGVATPRRHSRSVPPAVPLRRAWREAG
jgi:hypothetical protein